MRHGQATRFQILLLLLAMAPAAQAQVIPPGALDQLDKVVGQRVEAVAIIGTQSVASRSGLGWTLNDADGVIYKVPWKFELMKPMPLGDSGVTWTPVVEGGLGYGEFENHFNNNVLAGNESDFKTVALSVGVGPRFYLSDEFSVLPAFDFLYAYTKNRFTANTALGQQLLAAADGLYVNWEAQTLSYVPSFELRYRETFGRWTPEFTSTYAYFTTQPIQKSTDALSFRSESMVWANKLDLDYLTSREVFGCPLRLGSSVHRTELYGGLRDAMGTPYYYQVDGRIMVDLPGNPMFVHSLGFSAGYYWCGNFDGISLGLEFSVGF